MLIVMRDKLIRIKRSRYKPEELLLMDLVDGMYIIQQTKSPNNVFWEKDNKIIFEIAYSNLRVNYDLIWNPVREKYNLTYTEMCSLMRTVVSKYGINFSAISTF